MNDLKYDGSSAISIKDLLCSLSHHSIDYLHGYVDCRSLMVGYNTEKLKVKDVERVDWSPTLVTYCNLFQERFAENGHWDSLYLLKK
jgi:hypothetical protein